MSSDKITIEISRETLRRMAHMSQRALKKLSDSEGSGFPPCDQKALKEIRDLIFEHRFY